MGQCARKQVLGIYISIGTVLADHAQNPELEPYPKSLAAYGVRSQSRVEKE